VKPPPLRRALIWIVPLVILLLHIAYYYPFFADDGFISLRYARRLVDGQGLTWNDGERVEGYSNLLWVLLTAAAGRAGIDLVIAARVLGVLSVLATAAALASYCRRFGLRDAALWWTAIIFATTAPVAIWAIGGLESAAVMALLAWSYVLSATLLDSNTRSAAAATGAMLACVSLLRPEGVLFSIAIGSGLLMFAAGPRNQRLISAAIICASAFGAAIGQLVFRLAYYRAWLPNTFYAKVALTTERLVDGVRFGIDGVLAFLPIVLVMVLTVSIAPADVRRRHRLFGWTAAAWIAMVTVGGGDTFPGFRHLLPVIPLFMFVLIDCCDRWFQVAPRIAVHTVAACIVVWFAAAQFTSGANAAAKAERWEWQGRELGEALKARYAATRPLVAVTAAGSIPYYAGLPALDMYGLNDAYLTRHRPATFGRGYPGNELFDPDYVLARRPDIIVWHVGDDLHPVGIDTRFADRDYEARLIVLPSYTARILVRRGSPAAR
jgi:arabinofuranosyltransferase